MTLPLPPMPENAGGLYFPRGFGWMVLKPRPIELSTTEKLNILAQAMVDRGDELTMLKCEIVALKKRVSELENR